MIEETEEAKIERILKEKQEFDDKLKTHKEKIKEVEASSDALKSKISENEESIKKRKSFLDGSDMRIDNEAFTALALLFSKYFSILEKGYIDLRNGFNEVNIKNLSNSLADNNTIVKNSKESIEEINALKKEYETNGKLTKEMMSKYSLSEKTKEELLAFQDYFQQLDNGDISSEKLDKIKLFGTVLTKAKENLTKAKETDIKSILAGGLIETIEGDTDTSVDKNKETSKDEEKDYDRQRNTLKDNDRLRASAPKLRAR